MILVDSLLLRYDFADVFRHYAGAITLATPKELSCSLGHHHRHNRHQRRHASLFIPSFHRSFFFSHYATPSRVVLFTVADVLSLARHFVFH